MKIYIAGGITGVEDYYSKFEKAELNLRLKGHIVLNPAKSVAIIDGLTHEEYMIICKAMIDVCEGIVFLPNWKESKGAKLEKKYAEKLDKEIIYLEEKEWKKIMSFYF